MFSKSRRISGLYIAPGNAGTDALGANLPHIDPADSEAVLKFCKKEAIDQVFAGTETPLASGVVETMQKAGFPVFGAPRNSLRLESDRGFSREFMARHGIPHSRYAVIDNLKQMHQYLEEHQGERLVIKRNALAASREMIDCDDPKALLRFAESQLKNGSIIVEEHLQGLALTLTALIDGEGYLILPNCSEYTKSEEDDRGEATGGMGAICPVPILNKQTYRNIIDRIVEPTLNGIKMEGLRYQGVLLFSLIVSNSSATVVDYHVRFNDPATQALLPLITSDFMDILEAVHDRKISSFALEVSELSSVAVVLASKGYPRQPETGKQITSLPYKMKASQQLFYGAVEKRKNRLVTSGGRCFTAVGLGENIQEANKQAYQLVPEISYEGKWFRNDIGNRFFEDEEG